MKRFLLIAILILGILFRIYLLQPTWIHWDENYYINIFQNYVDRGELTPYMWRLGSETNIIAGSGTGYGIFILIGWLSVFGESLISLRVLMMISGLLSAGLYYLIAKKWWDSNLAGVVALIYGLVSANAFFSLVGRMDALGNLSYSLLLLLHIYAVRQERKWPHFFVGVLAILTVEVHTLGLLYLGGLAVFYGVEFIQSSLRQKRLFLNSAPVYFFLGAGILGVVYVIVHILPDPKQYFMIASTCTICQTKLLPALFLRIWKLVGFRPIDLMLTLLVVFTAIKQRRSHPHYLLILTGYFAAQLIFNPPPYVQYSQHLVPLISIGVGGMVAHILVQVQPDKQQVTQNALLLAALLILGFNYFSFEVMKKPPFPNAYWMPEAAEFTYIKENVPKSTVIMTLASFFYPLKEYHNFLAYEPTFNYHTLIYEESASDFLFREDPQVIVLNATFVESNPLLQEFIAEKDLKMVTENLWVAEEFVQPTGDN